MERKRSLRWLLAAVMSCVSLSAAAQSEWEGGAPDAGVPSANASVPAAAGEWFWVEGFDSLPDDVVTVVADAKKDGIWYAGGRSGLLVSRDDGENWSSVSLRGELFSSSTEAQDDDNDDDEIISRKKDLIRDELENLFNAEFAEAVVDGLDDAEVLAADHTDDIDGLSDFSNLSIELREVVTDNDLKSSVDAEEEAESNGADDTDRHDFWNSLRVMMEHGAEAEAAAAALTSSGGTVWQIESTDKGTFALAGTDLLATRDQGSKWDSVYRAPELVQPYSFAVTQDARSIAVGTSAGVSCSTDGGKNWNESRRVSGIVYKLAYAPDGAVLALTTDGVWKVQPDCSEAEAERYPLRAGERVIDAAFAGAGAWMATEANVYEAVDGAWRPMLDVPFRGQPVRQLLIGKNDRLTVRTETAIYEFGDNGWAIQDTGIFGDFTRHMSVSNKSKKTAAVMITDQAILVAARSQKALQNPEKVDYLNKLWANEPTLDELIYAALDARGLLDGSANSWKTRIWTSMILPNVEFEFSDQRKMTSKATRTMELNTSEEITKYTMVWDQQREKLSYWQIMAKWDIQLARYEKQELEVNKLYKEQAGKRESVVKAVKTAFKKRRAKQLKEVKNKLNWKDLLEVEKQETVLFFLTDGRFVPKR